MSRLGNIVAPNILRAAEQKRKKDQTQSTLDERSAGLSSRAAFLRQRLAAPAAPAQPGLVRSSDQGLKRRRQADANALERGVDPDQLRRTIAERRDIRKRILKRNRDLAKLARKAESDGDLQQAAAIRAQINESRGAADSSARETASLSAPLRRPSVIEGRQPSPTLDRLRISQGQQAVSERLANEQFSTNAAVGFAGQQESRIAAQTRLRERTLADRVSADTGETRLATATSTAEAESQRAQIELQIARDRAANLPGDLEAERALVAAQQKVSAAQASLQQAQAEDELATITEVGPLQRQVNQLTGQRTVQELQGQIAGGTGLDAENTPPILLEAARAGFEQTEDGIQEYLTAVENPARVLAELQGSPGDEGTSRELDKVEQEIESALRTIPPKNQAAYAQAVLDRLAQAGVDGDNPGFTDTAGQRLRIAFGLGQSVESDPENDPRGLGRNRISRTKGFLDTQKKYTGLIQKLKSIANS